MKSIVFFILMSVVGPILAFAQSTHLRWYKGNTHTHTKNSDGDSQPDVVVKWYADRKYNFLFITDHEFLTPVEQLNQQFGKSGEFQVMLGQEVTDRVGNRPHHVNGLGISKVCMPGKGLTTTDNLQKNVDCIREAGGVPQINHPNFGWALSASDIGRVRNVSLMEIHNGHPLVNNLGGGGSPGAEEIWDTLLTAGMKIYGIGDDDSHSFTKLGDRSQATPGQAWVVVRAAELSQNAILTALDKGDFYASTGVELNDISFDGRQLRIDIKAERSSRYTIQFIGRKGKILKTTVTNPAVYSIGGNETYVRAKIVESNGKQAWTQPVFLKKK